jgi:hypothetical protein
MAQEVSVIVRDDDRARLEAIVGDRNRCHKHVQRAWIVLLSAERLRWQRRYAEAGAAGLLRDKTRPPGTHRCRPRRSRGW